MKYYLKVLKECLSFDGRISRKEYWMFQLVNIIIFSVLFILLLLSNSFFIGAIFLIYVIFAIYPNSSATIKRLHDTGKSGWLYLAFFLPYFFLTFIKDSNIVNKEGWIFIIAIITLIGSLVLLILTVMKGDDKENKYENISDFNNRNLVILKDNKIYIITLVLFTIFNIITMLFRQSLKLQVMSPEELETFVMFYNKAMLSISIVLSILFFISLFNSIRFKETRKIIVLNLLAFVSTILVQFLNLFTHLIDGYFYILELFFTKAEIKNMQYLIPNFNFYYDISYNLYALLIIAFILICINMNIRKKNNQTTSLLP